MPTRKQRRRALKERRHEYETVWVDAEGNELDEPPEDLVETAPEKRDGAKPKPKPNAKAAPQRGGRSARVPLPPSWRRAAKRALMLGGVIFVLFYLLGSRNGGNRFASALLITVIYTALFIPFTFYVDRFSYRRWQRRAELQGQKGSAKKR
jgi:hypothetical protein